LAPQDAVQDRVEHEFVGTRCVGERVLAQPANQCVVVGTTLQHVVAVFAEHAAGGAAGAVESIVAGAEMHRAHDLAMVTTTSFFVGSYAIDAADQLAVIVQGNMPVTYGVDCSVGSLDRAAGGVVDDRRQTGADVDLYAKMIGADQAGIVDGPAIKSGNHSDSSVPSIDLAVVVQHDLIGSGTEGDAGEAIAGQRAVIGDGCAIAVVENPGLLTGDCCDRNCW
jgi:hypothetical protein